jgi:nucleotide-binding universal stress UspA family protein
MGIRSEPRSDLFALGALLYFFTTGNRPFGDPQGLSMLRRRLWWDPQPPRVLRKECPPWLQEVILRCLEVEPQRRHASAAQLAFDLRHPAQVPLTARAEKLARDPWSRRMRRRFNPDYRPRLTRPAAEQVSAAPIILVAVDLAEQRPAIAEALRTTIGHVLATVPRGRVACVNVWQQKLIGMDSALDSHGHNKHVQRLVELKHWAAPLRLPEDRVTFHVLEATNPADALLDYARTNNVDHIVIGASTRPRRSKLLGSVSGAVAAQAPCTVTVVRPRVRAEELAA